MPVHEASNSQAALQSCNVPIFRCSAVPLPSMEMSWSSKRHVVSWPKLALVSQDISKTPFGGVAILAPVAGHCKQSQNDVPPADHQWQFTRRRRSGAVLSRLQDQPDPSLAHLAGHPVSASLASTVLQYGPGLIVLLEASASPQHVCSQDWLATGDDKGDKPQ